MMIKELEIKCVVHEGKTEIRTEKLKFQGFKGIFQMNLSVLN